MEKRTFLKTMGLTLVLPATGTLAQIGSGRPIRVIVPLPPGTSNDTSTRLVSPAVSKLIGQPIIIDNKPGANGVIGAADVIRAAPDGMTLMCGSISPLAANVAFVKNLPYDPLRAFTAIAGSTITNHVLAVKGGSPIRSVADFISMAKQRPGKVTVGYSTSIALMQIRSMNKFAGIELMPIPYKGVPATVTDVIGGVIDATLGNPGPTMSMEKSGMLRALGVSSLKRNPSTPNWPAISETLPGFDFPSWNAWVGPANMPRELVNRLSTVIAQAQQHEQVVQQLANEGTVPLILGPDELKTFMTAEVAKYVRLAKDYGIQPE